MVVPLYAQAVSQAMTAEAVVRELRRRRASARPRPKGWELIAWGQVIVLLIAYAAFGLWLLVGGPPIVGQPLDLVRARGAAAAGLGVAMLAALSLRSGLRGGPLSVARADVQHLLLGPVDRAAVLRPLAVRHLARNAGIGLVTGGIAGLLTAARLPGGYVPWIASGAVAGTLTGVLMAAPAMVVSGRRVRERWVNAIWLALLATGAADLVAGTQLAPSTWFGALALWPLGPNPLAIAAIPVTLAVAAAALASVGGTSVEALDRRAGLLGELQFAAANRDVRALTRTGHQLAEETPRERPWLRLPAGRSARWAVWRRDWQSLLRWPAGRLVRVAAMGLGIGAALALAWAGASYFLVLAGGLAYMAALEVLEPWSQEVERPDLTDSVPAGRLMLLSRHLAAAVVAEALIGLVALATVSVLRPPAQVLAAAAVLIVPAAICAVCGAAIRGRTAVDTRMSPDQLGISAFTIVLNAAGPPSIAILGLVPVLFVRDSFLHGGDPVGTAITSGIVVAIVSLLVLAISRSGQFFAAEQ
jgi:hypothetical protein